MRTITFDLDTGDMLAVRGADDGHEVNATMTGAVAARIASFVLPGMTPEDVDGAYGEHLSRSGIDPLEADVTTLHATVLTPYGLHGTVIGTKSTDGTVHSVQVRMDAPGNPAEWMTPADLILVTDQSGE